MRFLVVPLVIAAITTSFDNNSGVVVVVAKRVGQRHHVPTPQQEKELEEREQQQEAGDGGLRGGGAGDASKQKPTTKQGGTTSGTMSGLTSEDVMTFISGQTCAEKVFADVVIVGAGMAGIQAAATLQQYGVSYVILESSHNVGGRVHSHTMSNGIVVEDGANWIYEIDGGNPVWDLAQQLGLVAPFHDVDNVAMYDETGWPLDMQVYQNELERFNRAWNNAANEADNQWDRSHATYVDTGVQSLLVDEGWSISGDEFGNMQYTIQWESLDWEYAEEDTSVRYFPYAIVPNNGHVADTRGFEIIPQTMFANNVNQQALKTVTRVKTINYNEWELYGSQGMEKRYRARVDTLDIRGCSTSYFGQRVISTVSVGVLNNDLITFNPPLSYNRNPFKMATYIKIFYQFATKFWDDTEFIRVIRDLQHRGHCHHWQSMDVPGKFYEGSSVIRCDLTTEVYESLVDTDGYLSQATLMELLDPLRLVYGPDVVGTPLDVYYAPLNKDLNWGYGAYANWQPGFTFNDFAQYFGGTSLTNYCQHNGCNDIDEWVLILSGAASCYDYAETVHGGVFAGEKAANIVLNELGYNAPTGSRCDTNWRWLQ